MTNVCTMETLITNSIRVTPGMVAVFPQYADESIINVSEIVPKFSGCFATNNSTVAFIYNDEFYATPYTRNVMRTLRENGFREAYFYVPFSNWDYPKNYRWKWENLREKAQESWHQDFVSDCIDYCEKKGIGKLSEEVLQKCFEMPSSGVKVTHLYFETTYYPEINNDCLDCVAADKLGTFNTNNGRVVFVYCDGRTFVAKGYKILSELRAAGYKEAGLFVPFSNGEEIQNPVIRSIWESISK